MAISFQSLQNILPILVTSKLPILVRGRHGIGKSQIVFQLGEELGLPVIDRRASQMTEGDLLGLPKQVQDRLHRACYPILGRGGSCNS
jgi:MoxR-like ATPase